jgi:hypothetical protein
MNNNFIVINSSKANFDEIYSMADPRDYFSVLGSLDYMIPDVAEPVVRQILDARKRRYSGKPRLLDVGSSYGINAAVHRFPVTFAALHRRYSRREMAGLNSDELSQLDANYYASWPEIGVADFVGLDVSVPAIDYAKRVGLIEHGIAADLEHSVLTPEDAKIIGDVDVILSTGSVGYVTDKTFRQVLGNMPRAPWIISFVLRMFPYDALTKLFAEHGLVTERLAGAVFAQRRFRDVAEFDQSLAALAHRGVETGGYESDGLLRADLYVSRPESDVQAERLEDIVTVTSGGNRPTGVRYVAVATDEGRRVALEP